MEVIPRYVGQKVRIGDTVITVLEIRRGAVRLGIESPKQVPVFRQEIWTGKEMKSNAH